MCRVYHSLDNLWYALLPFLVLLRMKKHFVDIYLIHLILITWINSGTPLERPPRREANPSGKAK